MDWSARAASSIKNKRNEFTLIKLHAIGQLKYRYFKQINPLDRRIVFWDVFVMGLAASERDCYYIVYI